MEIPDWITLGAIIVALGIGVSSLVQMQRLQKRERKERLLNEIIEWTVNLMKCSFETGLEITTGLSDEKQWKLNRINWAFRYQAIDAKSEYVKSIASAFKGELALQAHTEKVTTKLKKLLKLLWEYARAENVEEKNMSDKVNKEEHSLWETTNKLIKEVTKIKLINIGRS